MSIPRPTRPHASLLAAKRGVSDLLGRNTSRREHEHLRLRLRQGVRVARADAVLHHLLTVGSHLMKPSSMHNRTAAVIVVERLAKPFGIQCVNQNSIETKFGPRCRS